MPTYALMVDLHCRFHRIFLCRRPMPNGLSSPLEISGYSGIMLSLFTTPLYMLLDPGPLATYWILLTTSLKRWSFCSTFSSFSLFFSALLAPSPPGSVLCEALCPVIWFWTWTWLSVKAELLRVYLRRQLLYAALAKYVETLLRSDAALVVRYCAITEHCIRVLAVYAVTHKELYIICNQSPQCRCVL